ncbi:MAG: 2,3-bisphosphoglycerate-independent phosphoglycerate mutase [Mycoplasma sp.]|nr:2,3-bisphosphoglycerate-independent phosphoglycerate mutase [Mycoplasma sp.]
MNKTNKPLVLVVLDGFGYSFEKEGNAINLAKTPNFDNLFNTYPNILLNASGEHVGLPPNQMGNSEVGHLNIGAGEIVYTGLSLIDHSIKTNAFYTNPVFLEAIDLVKNNNSTLHLYGLLSNGGVHSHIDHLISLIKLANQNNLSKVSLHLFLDGRDTPPTSGLSFIKQILELSKKYKFTISSVAGRLYGMDRDKRFEKTEKSYNAMLGNATNNFLDLIDYINSQYSKKITDEFIDPTINKNGLFVKDNDVLISFNFRPDRIRQLTHFFIGSDLYQNKPPKVLKNLKLVAMMPYDGIDNVQVAFDNFVVSNPLGKILEQNKIKQLRVAETQKYAHVTYFFDGGQDVIYDNSQRIMIESLKIDNFAEKPEMSANGITNKIIENWSDYDVIITNYANADMVGHTGNLEKTIIAITTLDHEIGRLFEQTQKEGGVLFITADHGNAEVMLDKNNNPSTKHTNSLVPFIITDNNVSFKTRSGKLADITPTILYYLGIKPIKEHTGKILISK